MFRTLLSLFLILTLAAQAQTGPTTSTKATKATTRTKATVRRPAKKTPHTTVRKTTTNRVGATKPNNNSTIGSTTRNDIGPGGNGAVGSTASADSKGQNVYAAPGEPVNVQSGPVGTYNGRPAGQRTTKGGTTLSPK